MCRWLISGPGSSTGPEEVEVRQAVCDHGSNSRHDANNLPKQASKRLVHPQGKHHFARLKLVRNDVRSLLDRVDLEVAVPHVKGDATGNLPQEAAIGGRLTVINSTLTGSTAIGGAGGIFPDGTDGSAGMRSRVKILDGVTFVELQMFEAFAASFTRGLFVG